MKTLALVLALAFTAPALLPAKNVHKYHKVKRHKLRRHHSTRR